jgi:hypothetical protein
MRMGFEKHLSDQQVEKIDSAVKSGEEVYAENTLATLRESVNACSPEVWRMLNGFENNGAFSLDDDAQASFVAAKRALAQCKKE